MTWFKCLFVLQSLTSFCFWFSPWVCWSSSLQTPSAGNLHFYDFTDHYFTLLILFFLLFFEGVKFFSTQLVLARAQLPLSSSFSLFWAAFCQRWSVLQACDVQPDVVCNKCAFLFFRSTEKPFLFVPCWWLVIFCLCHPARLQESRRNSAGSLACGLR